MKLDGKVGAVSRFRARHQRRDRAQTRLRRGGRSGPRPGRGLGEGDRGRHRSGRRQAVAWVGSVVGVGFAERFVQTAVWSFGGRDIIVNNVGYAWDTSAGRRAAAGPPSLPEPTRSHREHRRSARRADRARSPGARTGRARAHQPCDRPRPRRQPPAPSPSTSNTSTASSTSPTAPLPPHSPPARSYKADDPSRPRQAVGGRAQPSRAEKYQTVPTLVGARSGASARPRTGLDRSTTSSTQAAGHVRATRTGLSRSTRALLGDLLALVSPTTPTQQGCSQAEYAGSIPVTRSSAVLPAHRPAAGSPGAGPLCQPGPESFLRVVGPRTGH